MRSSVSGLRTVDSWGVHSSGLSYSQCGGSEMFIPDPGSWFLPIPDPGSKNSNKREGWKKIWCHTFLCCQKFYKIVHYFSFEVLKKKIWANFQRIIEPFTQKIVTKLSKYGFGIRDPEKTYSGSRIPGSKTHRIPDPDPQHWNLLPTPIKDTLENIPISISRTTILDRKESDRSAVPFPISAISFCIKNFRANILL